MCFVDEDYGYGRECRDEMEANYWLGKESAMSFSEVLSGKKVPQMTVQVLQVGDIKAHQSDRKSQLLTVKDSFGETSKVTLWTDAGDTRHTVTPDYVGRYLTLQGVYSKKGSYGKTYVNANWADDQTEAKKKNQAQGGGEVQRAAQQGQNLGERDLRIQLMRCATTLVPHLIEQGDDLPTALQGAKLFMDAMGEYVNTGTMECVEDLGEPTYEPVDETGGGPAEDDDIPF